MRSSFAGFTTGLLGMQASQYGLDITGHNVANINTRGYTRQRIDQYSLSMTNGSGKWDSRIGHGVVVSGISQVRDPYLDVRFRNEVAQVGYSDSTLAGLEDLQSILNEVGVDASLSNQFLEFSTNLSKLAQNPKDKELENLVRSSADTLTKYINQYAKKVELAQSETVGNFNEQTIPEVNDLLEKIRELNVSIEDNQKNGSPSLELVDQRNIYIDQLANYAKIEVTYVPTSIAGTNKKYDQLNINLMTDDINRPKISLIKGVGDPAKFSSSVQANGDLSLSVTPSNPPQLADALGGYPPLNGSALETEAGAAKNKINTVLDNILAHNRTTNAKYGEVEAQKVVVDANQKTLSDAKKVLAALKPNDPDYEAKKTAAEADIEAARTTLQDSQAVLAERNTELTALKDARKPELVKLQEMLPGIRFNESEGNMTATFTYAQKNYTLVNGDKAAEFSTDTAAGEDRQLVKISDAGDPVKEATLGKFPSVSQDNIGNVNRILLQMQKLEENPPTEAVPPTNPSELQTARDGLLTQLKAAMPNAKDAQFTTDTSVTPFKLTYTENGKDYNLVDGTTPPAQFSINNNCLMIIQTNPPEAAIEVTESISEGSLKGTIGLVNNDGLFDADTTNARRGYGYYTNMLDTLAVTMANAFNEANAIVRDANGAPIHDDKGNTIGGDMFSSGTAGVAITAKNICIDSGWSSGKHGLVASRNQENGKPANTGAADNLLHMEKLLNGTKTTFLKDPYTEASDTNGAAFSGTFRECFLNMHGMLATDIKTETAILENHITVANDISNNIDQVSSVSLDEEGVNMLHYQKSLTASIRFMTTIDEALNTIINNMGVVGR